MITLGSAYSTVSNFTWSSTPDCDSTRKMTSSFKSSTDPTVLASIMASYNIVLLAFSSNRKIGTFEFSEPSGLGDPTLNNNTLNVSNFLWS